MYTLPQIAKRIGCTRNNVYQHVQQGNLPATRVGGVYIVDEADARAFAARQSRTWTDLDAKRSTPRSNGS